MIELEYRPYGVGHGAEGICLSFRLGRHCVWFDCGLRSLQDIPNGQRLPETVDFVVCSHAHPDHARGLLELHQRAPQVPIYASEVTARLLPLNWLDRAPVPNFCHGLPLRSPVALADDLELELYPAGHLPGAVVSVLTYTAPSNGDGSSRTYRIAYTGDFFLSNARLVEGLPLTELRSIQPDVLVIEGSYGTDRHPRRRTQENQLAERISEAIANRQSVLLPAPILGSGQELLMLLRSHHYFTGHDFTIGVDDAIAAGCDAYLDILSSFPNSVQNFARHQNLFWDDRVRPRMRRLRDSDRPDAVPGPSVLLIDKARLLEDPATILKHYCATGQWLILLPQDNYTSSLAELPDQLSSLAIAIEPYLLSEHCDAPGTLQLIHNLRPQHVIFVHGTPENLANLTSLGELNSRYQIHCPGAGAAIALPIGDVFLQPAAPAERYEAELSETEEGVVVHLPEAIAQNPRWQALADTGLLEARWQGTDLVLRGLSQRELLDREETWVSPETLCCQNCHFYRHHHCRNPQSPLANLRVDPDGCCPVFRPAQSHSS